MYYFLAPVIQGFGFYRYAYFSVVYKTVLQKTEIKLPQKRPQSRSTAILRNRKIEEMWIK